MRRFVIGVFLLLLVSPFFGWLLDLHVELKENRFPAKAPELALSKLMEREFFPQLERFFDDHFVFRAWLIKTKSWIDYYVFRTPSSPLVHLGTDGWLYFRETLHSYRKDECDARDAMWDLARRLHTLERVLLVSGRQFVFMVAPEKSTIYPEYVGLPRSRSGCKKSRYDFLLEAFADYPVMNFVRLDTILVQAKKEREVYYRTDTHWNSLGSLIASGALLRHLSPSRWMELLPDTKPSTASRIADLAQMLALDFTVTVEDAETVLYRTPVKVEGRKQLMNRRPRLRYTATSTPKMPLLPRAVFYHDSFGAELTKFILGSFEQLDVYWTYDMLETPEAVEDLRSSRIVVVEVVERNLADLTVNPSAVAVVLADDLAPHPPR